MLLDERYRDRCCAEDFEIDALCAEYFDRRPINNGEGYRSVAVGKQYYNVMIISINCTIVQPYRNGRDVHNNKQQTLLKNYYYKKWGSQTPCCK